MEANAKDTEDKDALEKCFHSGWLYTNELSDFGMQYKFGYLFPSPLHQWYVGWKLCQETIADDSFDANNLLTFAIEVISHYYPANLRRNLRVGPGCVRWPTESLYQDKFYCCSHTLSNGSIVMFPEFGIENGQAEFYIPIKKWSIEILHNAYQLDQHLGQFLQPSSYTETFPSEDHVILNFSDMHPVAVHSSKYLWLLVVTLIYLGLACRSSKSFPCCIWWRLPPCIDFKQ